MNIFHMPLSLFDTSQDAVIMPTIATPINITETEFCRTISVGSEFVFYSSDSSPETADIVEVTHHTGDYRVAVFFLGREVLWTENNHGSHE